MDFLDIEGATQWGDGSNEKLHCALFSASLSMKKKKKKKTTTGVNHMSEQKSLEFGGQEPALTIPKKRKGKSCEKQEIGEHGETVEVHPHEAKRKYVEKEEVGGNEQTCFGRHSQKAKRKSIEKEGVLVDGNEQTHFHIHSKKAKKNSIGEEGVDVHETSERKVKRKSFESFDKKEYNCNSKQFRLTDTVNEDDESGRNLARARSIFREEGQDVECRKRKKRKRKPRNNKFEGWAKKGVSQPSEKVNGVEERSLKVKDDGSMWKETGEEDLPCEKMIGGGTNEDKKEGLKVDSIFEGFVQEKNERIVNERKKRKSGEEDQGSEEQAGDTKTDENLNADFISEDEANYRNKTADVIRKKQEKNHPKYEQNFEDKQQHDESKIIYADKKKRCKGKGELGGGAWDKQLRSARFRFINETLYKSSGAEAFKTFKGDRAAFEVYHEGYSQQVQQWPENPVDIIIKYLKKRPQSWIVGDFGCGEAKIAQSVHQKVLSFDIFRANENVTVCNISKVPLRTESLDVAVYCLSLMGSNWPDYLREGNRVLKKGGLLKIAEVASRFKSVDSFVSLLNKLGFTLKGKDLTNKMFYMFHFEKKKSCGQIPDKMASILKPCKYKRR